MTYIMPVFYIYMDPYWWLVTAILGQKHHYEFIEWTKKRGKKEISEYLVKREIIKCEMNKEGWLLISPKYSRKESRLICTLSSIDLTNYKTE
jgi:hypothetical protein